MKEIHKPRMSANRAMVTDANGNPTPSPTITTMELNMLNNIRTNIQSQIDAANTDANNAFSHANWMCFMPNWAGATQINLYNGYTTTANCWLFFNVYTLGTSGTYSPIRANLKINNVTYYVWGTTMIPVPPGTTLKWDDSTSSTWAYIIPITTGN